MSFELDLCFSAFYVRLAGVGEMEAVFRGETSAWFITSGEGGVAFSFGRFRGSMARA